MATPNLSVQKAFLSGLQIIYKELFQYGYIRFLDTASTEVDDVYGETNQKVYEPPIKILCHYVRDRSKDTDPIKETDEKVTIKVPVKEFQDNDIPFETREDLKVLRQAVIIFNDEAYQIDEVNTKSMVAGQFLVISFNCSPCDDYVDDTPSEDEEPIVDKEDNESVYDEGDL